MVFNGERVSYFQLVDNERVSFWTPYGIVTSEPLRFDGGDEVAVYAQDAPEKARREWEDFWSTG